jgi:hypothetical protein
MVFVLKNRSILPINLSVLVENCFASTQTENGPKNVEIFDMTFANFIH